MLKIKLFKNGKGGFALIELLVVIAIIGVLSSIVLASLNTARNKGNDAAIKANLSNIRASTEIYYDNNSNAYGADFALANCPAADAAATNMFAKDANIAKAVVAANTSSGSNAKCAANDSVAATTGTAATSWAISSVLKQDTTKFYCVDSTGFADTGTKQATINGTSNLAVCG